MLINAITIEAHIELQSYFFIFVEVLLLSILLCTALICHVIEQYECSILKQFFLHKHIYFCKFYIMFFICYQMFMFSFIDQITSTVLNLCEMEACLFIFCHVSNLKLGETTVNNDEQSFSETI